MTARGRRALGVAAALLLAGLGGLLAWLWLAPPPSGLEIVEELALTPPPDAAAPVEARLGVKLSAEADSCAGVESLNTPSSRQDTLMVCAGTESWTPF